MQKPFGFITLLGKAIAVLVFTNKVNCFSNRFMQGFGVSAAFSVLPVFIGEVSESHNRGGLSCMQGIFIISGLLFSYVVGPYVTVQVSMMRRQHKKER